MCEMAARAGGGVAVDVDSLAAMSGPAALEAVRLILPEGALGHISFSVDGLRGRRREEGAVNRAGFISFCPTLLGETTLPRGCRHIVQITLK